ncbi:MAG: HK97 family phage prohead protease [Armatimonadetes bacterium]|nr:HK97 family phage prohead protease [Armatimonadota bacterium]
MDTSIAFGTEIKTLSDDGETMRLGGHLVLFGTPDEHDLNPLDGQGRGHDYFTKNTDFGLKEGKGVAPVLYHHGLNPVLRDRHLSTAHLSIDDDGVWMETELKARDKYEKRVMELVRKGKLGLSSGAWKKDIEREAKATSSGEPCHEIKKWHLGMDASLTPTPCDPRTMVMEMKSIEDVEEWDDELTETAEFKAQYLGEWIENDMAMAGLSRLNDALMYRVVASALSPSDYPLAPPFEDFARMTVAERKVVLKAAFEEFQTIALDLIGRAMENGKAEAKALSESQHKSNEALAPELKSFADHRDAALDAVDGFISRAGEIKTLRASRKSGAPISASMRENLTAASSRLVELKATVDAILATDVAPKDEPQTPEIKAGEAPADPAEVDAAWQAFIENNVKMAGIDLPAPQE